MRKQVLVLGLIVGGLFAGFQNCSRINFASQPTKLFQGGTTGGTDGMKYRTFALCPDGDIGIEKEVQFTSDLSTAKLVTKNCAPLVPPVSIPISQIHFAYGIQNVFTWEGQIFDAETTQPNTTTAFCSSTDIDALAWLSPNGFMGTVATTQGYPVPLYLSSPQAGVYVSKITTSGSMKLSVTDNSVAWSAGQPIVNFSETNLSCLTQPVAVTSYNQWSIGPWQACRSPSTMQTRSVICVNNLTGFMATSGCPTSKPETVQSCYPGAITPTTVIISPSSNTHTWTAPQGVTSVTFTTIGGGGGGANPRGGDGGGEASATFSVAPGEAFVISVGSGGAPNMSAASSSVVGPNGSMVLGQGGNSGQTQGAAQPCYLIVGGVQTAALCGGQGSTSGAGGAAVNPVYPSNGGGGAGGGGASTAAQPMPGEDGLVIIVY